MKIKFEVVDSELDDDNRFVKAEIRYHESDEDTQTNPVPLIMAVLASSTSELSKGFPYKFPLIFD